MYIDPDISRERIKNGNCYKCNESLTIHKRCIIKSCNLLLCNSKESYCKDCKKNEKKLNHLKANGIKGGQAMHLKALNKNI